MVKPETVKSSVPKGEMVLVGDGEALVCALPASDLQADRVNRQKHARQQADKRVRFMKNQTSQTGQSLPVQRNKTSFDKCPTGEKRRKNSQEKIYQEKRALQ